MITCALYPYRFPFPDRIDSLDVSQIIFLSNHVLPSVGVILDDDKAFKVNPEVLNPLLNNLFKPG